MTRPVRAELHHAVAFRIAHLVAENTGALFDLERLPEKIELPVKDIVAEEQRRAAIADEIGADEERLRDALRLGLLRIFQPKSEMRAVAEIIAQHRHILGRGNDENLAQPAEHEGGERVTNHRLVVNREELFADDLGQRIKPGAGAARENNGFFIHKARVQPISRCRPFLPKGVARQSTRSLLSGSAREQACPGTSRPVSGRK